MKQYQAVIIRLQGRSREDEDTVTDLLNERARMGWTDHAIHAIAGSRILVVFSRET
jgi:hypothetical protein